MDYTIPEELLEIQKTTRKLVRDHLIPREKEIVDKGKVPNEVFDLLKKNGYYGICIPEEYGGMGLGHLGFALVLEELSKTYFDFSIPLTLTNGLGKGPIYHFGTEEQKQKYLPKFATGELSCAFALTEPNAGSDAASIQTNAVKKGDKWILNGTKHFITHGGEADIVVVMAVTDKEKGARGGITSFIVEKGTPGFSVARIQNTMAGPPEGPAELVFEDCEIPEENVIGEVGLGFKAAMTTLDESRLHTGISGLGVAKRCLEMSIDYAKQRQQFGKPIAQFQGIQFMLSEMAMEIYATEQMIYNAATRMDNGEKVTKECSIIKLFGSEMANRVVDKAVQIHGGMGYVSDLPLERFYRLVRVLRIFEGSSEIQKVLISRNLLAE
jgi:acyl-CoA dehydrogenase